jgi:hypothetical protein
VRRGIALAVALVVLILVVVGINGCLNSQKHTALRNYSRNVTSIVQQADSQISVPLFKTLVDAKGKSEIDVEAAINQARLDAQQEAQQAGSLSVPGDMSAAQRDLLLALNLRAGALAKLSDLVRTVLAGSGDTATAERQIAGQMEVLLASDVLYSQRVAPLISQALANNGITDTPPATATRFLPNVGWLDASTVGNRLNGTTSSAQPFVPGNHGSALQSVAVGSNTLVAGTTNHVSGAGAGVTFTVGVLNSGAFNEHNVKVDVTITRAGSAAITASKTIDQTTPGNTVSADIPVSQAPPLGSPTKVVVFIEGVPGENDLTNNKGTYTVIFSQ